jgi:hypothetical protein
MYKLGPVHQGILERGSKTGSFSYLLWPCRIGAFTAVIGKHYANFDTSEFPFSYIAEEEGKSVLTPAMNLLTVGTKRDSEKWSSNNWGWCLNAIEEKFNLKLNDWTNKTFIQLIDEWKQNSIKLNNIIAKDAQKEFDAAAMIGFGIDSSEDVKKKDFEAVRGIYGKNKFVNQLESESKSIELKASELANFITSLV